MRQKSFLLCCLIQVVAMAHAWSAPVPDAKAVKYMPDKMVFYAMVDPKNLWSRIGHLLPPDVNRGGKPVAPDPTSQKLLDLLWGAIDGPLVVAATGFDPNAMGLVVVPTRANGSRRLVSDILSMVRQQGLPLQTTNRKIAGVDTIVLTPGGAPPSKMGKSKGPSKRMMTPMGMGSPPDRVFIATPADVVIISTSESLLSSALQSAAKRGGLIANKSFATARGRIGAGQLLWVWGNIPRNQGPVAGNIEVSVRAEGSGLRFSGFVPLRAK